MSVTGTIKPPLPETIAMRDLDEGTRDQLISEGENVFDGRERFGFKRRQQQIAESYRKPQKPNGDGPSFA